MIQALGSKALFVGVDLNLWVTDGSQAGTTELNVAGASSELLRSGSYADFTVIGNRMLFVGTDSHFLNNLWVTDGTSAGTKELTVSGACSSGLFSQFGKDSLLHANFTVLGKRAFFAGMDAGGRISLWVTNGTLRGTTDIKASGAYSQGLNPKYFSVVGNRVFFNGLDASGSEQLWVSDGTSSGTEKLKVKGASPAGLNPFDITALAAKPVGPARPQIPNSLNGGCL